MSDVAAWLMQVDRTSRVAVGQLELIHIIAVPEYLEVPRAPDYCKRIVLWNNKIVPVVDISMLINKTSAYYQHNAVAIALYYDPDNQDLKYGGIQLTDMPVLDKVNNDQHIAEAELSVKWKRISLSGYRRKDNDIIPILDVQRLFSPGINLLSSP